MRTTDVISLLSVLLVVLVLVHAARYGPVRPIYEAMALTPPTIAAEAEASVRVETDTSLPELSKQAMPSDRSPGPTLSVAPRDANPPAVSMDDGLGDRSKPMTHSK